MKIFDIESVAVNILSPVVTIGMFDGVHVGHQAILQELKIKAAEYNTTPLVITFEEHPRIVLNHDVANFFFLSTQSEKFYLLEKYGIENVLLLKFTPDFARLSTAEFVQSYLIEKLKIKGIVLGYDNHFGNKASSDFENIYQIAEKADFFISSVEACICEGITISSTQIRNHIRASDIFLANKMLGYDYFFSGKIIHGKKMGRELGFPTANIALSDPKKMIPEQGVYAVSIVLQNKQLNGLMSIGQRPTFDFGRAQTIEVHILNFEKDIYGQEMTVTMMKKLRDQRKFNTSEELIQQIELDKTEALAFFQNTEV